MSLYDDIEDYDDVPVTDDNFPTPSDYTVKIVGNNLDEHDYNTGIVDDKAGKFWEKVS
jgi:hypothetical protein